MARRTGSGDSRTSTTGNPAYWDAQAANGNLLRGDQAVADFYGEKLNQLTPTQIGTYQTYENEKNSSLFDKWAPAVALGLASAGIAAPVGAAVGSAVGGGAGGAIAGGAAAGAVGSGIQGIFNGNLSAKSVGTGILGGALGGGLNYLGQNASASLAQNGVNPSLANGLVKAGTGAVGGAVSGGLSGQGAGAGALSGALRGGLSGASGAVGSSTGSPFLGVLAGGLGGVALGSLGSRSVGSPNGGASNYLGAGASGAFTGGQGNIGNMAGTSTDSTLAGTIGNFLPGVIQAGAGVYGSQNAAEKQTQADQNAINTQTGAMGNINNIWSTQQSLGQGADKSLGAALGTNGQPADYSGFENMPGYKFAVSQGTQAIQRQAAAMGNAYTPNTAAAVGQYVTGTASQDYNTYISQLMGAAGLGSTANTALTGANLNTSANISQLQQNQGQAQASGVMGGANAVGGAFGPNGVGTSLIGAAGRFLGGGSGGGGGGGGGGGVGTPNGSGVVNYGGQNPNGTGGNGTASDPYGANTAQYNANNPYTGYDGGVDIQTPTFDPNSVPMPNMPSIDTGSMDFGGSIDYGSDATDFLGGGW